MPEGLLRSKPATRRRNLLVVRAGDGSLHPNWLAGRGRRNFDLLVSYYGANEDRFRDDGEHYHAMRGTRWPAHHAILRDNRELLDRYDHVCFACDDLDASKRTWNALFRFCEAHGLDLAQPAILGPISHRITAPVPEALYRLTTFIEVMCPVFSRRALRACRATFGQSVSGWGLDDVWPKILRNRGYGLAIIDAVCVTHTRPLREGGLYRLLANLGVDPWTEKANLQQRYGVHKVRRREIARISRTFPRLLLSQVKQSRPLQLLRRLKMRKMKSRWRSLAYGKS